MDEYFVFLQYNTSSNLSTPKIYFLKDFFSIFILCVYKPISGFVFVLQQNIKSQSKLVSFIKQQKTFIIRFLISSKFDFLYVFTLESSNYSQKDIIKPHLKYKNNYFKTPKNKPSKFLLYVKF